MFCKYCNADLKPSDKVCPVCEKPINDVDGVANVAEDTFEDIDQSLFAPLESSDYNVVPEQQVEDLLLAEEQVNKNEIDNSEVSKKALEKLKELQEMNELNEPRKSFESKEYKNPMSYVPVIILVFLIMLLGFGFFLSRSPKMVFNTLINKVYKEINNNVITNIKNVKGNMSFQTNISVPDNQSNVIFEILNNIYFNADYEMDYENKKMLVKLNTKYDNEKLVDVDLYAEDNKGYIFLKDAYKKYISTDIEDLDDVFEKIEINDDYKIILSEVKNAVNKALKSEYFTKSREKIIVNNKNVSVIKNSLVINYDTAKQLATDILTYLSDSKSFTNSLSNISEINQDEIISSIEEEIQTINSYNAASNKNKVIVSIYTTSLTNEVIKMDISVEGDIEKTTLEFIKDSDDSYNIILKSGDITVNSNINLLEQSDGTQKVAISVTEPTSGTNFNLTVNTSVKYNTNLTTVDVRDSVDVDSLTEEETNQIMTQLMESKGIQKLSAKISELFNSAFGS